MADTTETYRILLAIEGEERLKKLADEVAKEEQALRKLAQQAAATGQSQSAFFALAEQHAQKIQALNGRIAETQKQMQAAGVGASRAGQAMQQLGYVVDDVQYGFKGIANNIAPLLTSLGAGAGLAGTVAIVSIAATQLFDHWDDFSRLIGTGGTETEAQRMERLEKATNRTADETQRLNKFKREQAAIQAQQTSVSKAEGQMTGAVNDAVAELGYGNAVKGLASINRTRYENSPEAADLAAKRDAAAESAARMRNQNQPASIVRQEEAKLRGRQGALDRKVEEMAAADLAKAATDPGRLQGLTNQVIANPGAFGRGGMAFAQRLMAASPETAATEAENRTIAGKDEARAGSKRADEREAQRAEADWLKFDQRQQQGRVRARAEQLQESGADQIVRRAMLGVARQGGNADQVLARGTKLFMDSGLPPEKANELAREQMRRRLDPSENPMSAAGERMRELMGPRQIHDIAGFKDRITTSGQDPAQQQLSELQKSNKSLQDLVQLVQNRTFPAVIN
jgi:hypothetical protein